MGLILQKLNSLQQDMQRRRLTRVRFDHRCGPVAFDVCFFIDETPAVLLFGARPHHMAFELAVRRGFEVDTSMPTDKHQRLCEALAWPVDAARPFSVRAFLQDFDAAMPAALPPDCSPRLHDLAAYRPDVDRSDGDYFCGWRDNAGTGRRVSEKNLHKTRRLLGEQAYALCARRNISSCWTHDPTDASIQALVVLPD